MSRISALVLCWLLAACGHDNWVEPAGHGTLSVLTFEGGPRDRDAGQLKARLEEQGYPLTVGMGSLGVDDLLIPTEQLTPALEEARRYVSSKKLTVRLAHPSDPGWFVVFEGGKPVEEQSYLVPSETRPPR
jgi:hypothetical protein